MIRTVQLHQPRPATAAHSSCRVCGCHDVLLDQVQDGAARLELGECPRCDHRWTQPLASARSFAPASRRQVVREVIPNAA